jgi:hypothetical protein
MTLGLASAKYNGASIKIIKKATHTIWMISKGENIDFLAMGQ